MILASGGYCANAPMVKEYDKYWGDDLSDHTLTTNVGTNTGDGIVMAQEVGADVTGMEIAQMMPSSSPLKGTLSDGIWGDASEQIWIDGNGKRFVNEYAERDVLTKASLGLDNGVFYIIYAGHGDDNGVGDQPDLVRRHAGGGGRGHQERHRRQCSFFHRGAAAGSDRDIQRLCSGPEG